MVKQGFRADINALRALAVIGVIGFHFGIPGFGGGFAGVDVFFVISGYLITLQIQQGLVSGTFKFGAFYVSRLRRIFPALALMCFAVMLFGWWFIFSNEYIEHAKSAFEALYFGSNNGFMTPRGGYFESVNTGLSPLLHTWSLSVEGQFYLIFPVLWVIIFKKSGAQQRNIVLLTLAVAMSYFLYDVQHHTDASFYSLPVRAWEFLAGACLVVLPQRLSSKLAPNAASVLGLVCLGAGGYFLNASLLWPGYWTLIPIIGTLLVLMAGDAASSRWLFNNWLMQRTGDMSYSLYLWHWPLVVFAKKYASAWGRDLSVFEVACLLIATTAFAALSWRYVELPIRQNKKSWSDRKILVLVLFVILGFWGGWRGIAISQGYPERLERLMPNLQVREVGLLSQNYFKTCALVQNIFTVTDKLSHCEINAANESKSSFVVWGDSHAQQYFPAINQAAIAEGYRGLLLARAACRPTLPNQFAYRTTDKYASSCAAFNNKVNQQIVETTSIRTVVLGRVWFHGESIDQTINLIKYLTSIGKKVVLIGVIPKPEFDIPQTWFYRQVWGGEVIKEITVSKDADELPAITEYLKTQLTPQIQQGSVMFIDPFSHFCDQSKCYFVKDGVKNFVDDNHITERKALEFVDEFKRALKE
jgi:peptidoglycan/LPS O-acetylase OafA/YrhL